MNHLLPRSVSTGFFFVCLTVFNVVAANSGGEQTYAELLQTYVHDGRVDYSGLKLAETELDLYLGSLDRTEPRSLTRSGSMALYINAYNACTLKLILEHFEHGRPVGSIKEIGGFFKKPWDIRFCRIGGETHTLDEIEHEILRPVFKDPRVHFALNCASRSCPPLSSEPYRAGTLERQLERDTRAFINDPGSNYLEGDRLYVSRIFKWFSEDFPDGVAPFFLRYAEGDLGKGLRAGGDSIGIRYLDYDWSLNGL